MEAFRSKERVVRNSSQHLTAYFLPLDLLPDRARPRGPEWLVFKVSPQREIANPTSRQRVDPSSPFYQHAHSQTIPESHTAAACGSFKSFY